VLDRAPFNIDDAVDLLTPALSATSCSVAAFICWSFNRYHQWRKVNQD